MLVLQSTLLSMGINALGFMKYIVKRYLYNTEALDCKDNNKILIVSQKSCTTTLDEYGLRFWPPLYIQRYTVVQEILQHQMWNNSIKKVVEFGCAELNFFLYLKSIPSINKVIFVDIDQNVLEYNQGKVLPTNNDYLTASERKQPLSVDIYSGSIADIDDRLLGMDAVIGIELIEHLYADVLDKVPLTVFGFIKPKLAVFTTPNLEFNVVFPNFTTKFRHYDHKFEWNRNQLKKWANKIITTYPEYTVEFDGIGLGPIGTENLGCCSQVAIFYRKDIETTPAIPTGFKHYKLLRRVDYPYEHQNESTIGNQIMLNKLRSIVSEASTNKEFIVNGKLEMPLSVILPYFSDYYTCIKELEYAVSKEYRTIINDAGEWLLISDLASSFEHDETSSNESNSKSNSSLNSNGEEYWLTDDDFKEEENNWNAGFSDSKLYYSTPMAKNQKLDSAYLNNLNGVDTISSNSDFFTTAIDNNDTNNDDMEISSTCNSSSIIVSNCNFFQDFVPDQNYSTINNEDVTETEEETLICNENSNSNNNVNDDMDISSCYNGNIIINNCNIYEDFVTDRNDSTINNEDISKTEKEILICNANYNANDKVNDVNKNKNCVQNSSNVFLKSGPGIAHELTSKVLDNFSSGSINDPDSMCSNRILLDENDYTENLLSTTEKETPSQIK